MKNSADSLIQFYEKCVKKNILEISDTFSVKKAEQIASFYNLDISDGIHVVFQDAKDAVDKSNESQIIFEQMELRKGLIEKAYVEDPRLKQILSEYSDLYGADKPIRMFNNYYSNNISDVINKYTASKEREKSEYLAYDRAAPELHQRYIDMMLNEKENLVEEFRMKVISEEDDETVFQSVIIGDINYSITPIGSVIVQCLMVLDPDCNIYGHPAYVDGSFIAKIYQKGEFIGTAELVLPKEGLTSKEITVGGISLCRADEDVKCQIEIIPKNLWKMEA